jgi:isorenieratene synthase
MSQVVVVGGGMAGMAAAAALAGAGAEVTVLEREAALGGRWGVVERSGFTQDGRDWDFPIERGIHGFWRQYRNLRSLLDRHDLSGHIVSSGRQELCVWLEGDQPRFMDVGDTVRNSPLPEPFAFGGLLTDPEFRRQALRANPLKMLGVARDMSHVFAFDPQRDMDTYDAHNVEQLVRRWPPFMKAFFEALVHMAFWVEARDCGLGAFMTSLQHYTVCDKRDIGFDYLGDDTQTCVFGPLAAAVEHAGGSIRLNTTVDEVLIQDGRVTGLRIGEETLHTDAVVLAVDPGSLKTLHTGELSQALPPPPRSLPHNTVRLWFKGQRAPERASNGMVVAPHVDNYFWLSDIQRPFVEWSRATGGSVVECHQYGANAVRAEGMTDEEVIEACTSTVESVWPGVAGTRLHAHLLRGKTGHPWLAPGAWARLPEIRTRLPNLALAGDWVQPSWTSFFLERATRSGLQAAHQLAPGLGLRRQALPEVLEPHPPSPGFVRTQAIARGMRELGLLPNLDR